MMRDNNSPAFSKLVSARYSCRAFLPEQVPRDVLDRVFSTALAAPSNCNTQPWVVHVASGGTLDALRRELPDAFARGEISPDFPYDGSYAGVYRERQHAAAQALYDALGITREDKLSRQAAFMRNFSFFDAPHVAFLFLPQPFGLREAADVGMFAQTLMLSMTANGLASCPQTALGFLAEPVRRQLRIADSERLLFGISFGYPDPAARVNACRTERAALNEAVTFHH